MQVETVQEDFMRNLRIAAVAIAVLIGGAAVVAGEALAMPVVDLAPAAHNASGVQDVRWGCGPYRCWWRPGPIWWHRPYWGPPPWHWHWPRHW
jgi:hypothetical protein